MDTNFRSTIANYRLVLKFACSASGYPEGRIASLCEVKVMRLTLVLVFFSTYSQIQNSVPFWIPLPPPHPPPPQRSKTYENIMHHKTLLNFFQAGATHSHQLAYWGWSQQGYFSDASPSSLASVAPLCLQEILVPFPSHGVGGKQLPSQEPSPQDPRHLDGAP